MFELERNFGALLRETAIFECVGKLVRFPDPHQKLGLGPQVLNLHAGLRDRGGEGSEVDVRGQILLAGSLVRVRAGRVLAIGHQGPAVASGKLFVAGVAVVDDEQETARDGVRDLRDPVLSK